MAKTKRVRWALYVPIEIDKDFMQLKDEFGFTKAQLALLLMKLGLNAFMRAYHPEKTLSTEEWSRIMEAARSTDV